MTNDLIEKFKTEKIAINVRTPQAFKEFMQLCDEHNLKWSTGDKASERERWQAVDMAIVYSFDGDTGLQYGPIDFYEDFDYKIIRFGFEE